VLGKVNHIHFPIAPAIQHANSIRVSPGRNKEGNEHIKRFHAFPEKLKLIQVVRYPLLCNGSHYVDTLSNYAVVFHTVWTYGYGIKALDAHKKARMVCDGSLRAGQAHVLDETYANCIDQSSSRMFYAIAATENLLIYGADVSNAFAEAPPPKQGFYIYPNRAFNEWWVRHLLHPPLEPGQVIPILSAMQGHSESPRLWEKHADPILQDIGMTPTVHEPCIYSGIINGKHTLLKRQVNDFAIAAPNERSYHSPCPKIDDELSIPMKQQGYLDARHR
jgi:hypothetical protein